MYNNFTEEAREILTSAKEEMKKLKQNASFLTKILLVVGLLISNLS